MTDDGDHQERSETNQQQTSIPSGIDRRSIIRMLGAGAFFAGPGAQLAAARDDLSEMSDEELIDQLDKLSNEINILITGSSDLLVAEYRSEALQILFNNVSKHDFNKSSKRTLLQCLESALEDNQQVMQAILDLDLKSASTYHQSVEDKISTFRNSVDVMKGERVKDETAESWREQAATIINAREHPLSVFELIEEEQTTEEWWEAIDNRGERIAAGLQELQDRGYSPTVEEINGEVGIQVNPPFLLGGYFGLKLMGYLGFTSVGLGIVMSSAQFQQLLLQLQQYPAVIQRLLYRAPIDDSTLLTVLDGILDLITLVEEYDPDEHDPIQFIGALLLILAARTADASYNSEAIDIVQDHLVEEAITDEEEEDEEEEDEEEEEEEEDEEEDTRTVWVPDPDSDSCSQMTVPADAQPDPAFETEEACLEYDGGFGGG